MFCDKKIVSDLATPPQKGTMESSIVRAVTSKREVGKSHFEPPTNPFSQSFWMVPQKTSQFAVSSFKFKVFPRFFLVRSFGYDRFSPHPQFLLTEMALARAAAFPSFPRKI